LGPPPQKFESIKTADLFLTTSQLSGKFEGQYLWRGTWYRPSDKCVGLKLT